MEALASGSYALSALGWISSICFSLCAAPQAYLSWKQGHSDGVAKSFLILWGMGEITGILYIIPFGNWPILTNYIVNSMFLLVIMWYRYFPRNPA